MALGSMAAQTIQGRLMLARMEQEKAARDAELLSRMTQQIAGGLTQGVGQVGGLMQQQAQRQQQAQQFAQKQALAQQEADARIKRDALAGAQKQQGLDMAAGQDRRAALAEKLQRAALGSSVRADSHLLAQAAGDPGAKGSLNFFGAPDQGKAESMALGMPGAQVSEQERAGIVAGDRREAAEASGKQNLLASKIAEANKTATESLSPKDPEFKLLEARRKLILQAQDVADNYKTFSPKGRQALRRLESLAEELNAPALVNWGAAKQEMIDAKAGAFGVNIGAEVSAGESVTVGTFEKAQAAQQALDKEINRMVREGELTPAEKTAIDEVKNFNAGLVGEILRGQGPVTDRDVDRTALLNPFGDPEVFGRRLQKMANERADGYHSYASLLSSRGRKVDGKWLSALEALDVDRFGRATMQVVDPEEMARFRQEAGNEVMSEQKVDALTAPKYTGAPPGADDVNPNLPAVPTEAAVEMAGAAGEQATKTGKALLGIDDTPDKEKAPKDRSLPGQVKSLIEDVKETGTLNPLARDIDAKVRADTALRDALADQKKRVGKSGRASKSGADKLKRGRAAEKTKATEGHKEKLRDLVDRAEGQVRGITAATSPEEALIKADRAAMNKNLPRAERKKAAQLADELEAELKKLGR